jgi:hypothetical protein
MFIFKKKYHDGIRNKTITETIRYWKSFKASQVQVGKITSAYELGYVLIHSIEEIKFDDITDEDAIKCGEESKESLQNEILETYKKLFPEVNIKMEKLYKIRFSFAYEEIDLSLN